MRPLKSLISLDEAKKIVNENIREIDRKEKVSIEDSLGRVLASDIMAEFDVPGFDRAAMDGYAVRAEDTFGASQFKPRILKMIDIVNAGETSTKMVHHGECIQIATGAKLPEGSNAVVIVEDTEKENGRIEVFRPVYPKANVSEKGEDIRKGDTVLKRGEVLNPSRIGILSALGVSEIYVYEKPKIGVIPTGREILSLNEKLEEGKVYDINSYTLMSIIRENGGIAVKYDIVEDTYENIKSAVENAMNNDMIVISGGSSVGERDVLFDVIKTLGKVLFHGVQIKPGKPTLFGLIDDKPVFGMPGYPTSCLVNAYTFLLPAVRKISRLPEEEEKIIRAIASRRIVSTLGRRQFLTVKIEKGRAIPVFKESGTITSMANAEGYIEIPENVDLIEKNEDVEVKLF
ncbi:MAG TPA: molybdenum cofactor biosynthesis protein [Thermoplasmata archaeon]|nr:molybdenum cofactor biosynthesis protein [Thermoplasmata archaeon]